MPIFTGADTAGACYIFIARDYGHAFCPLGFLVLFCLLIDEHQKAIGTLLEILGHWKDFVIREE